MILRVSVWVVAVCLWTPMLSVAADRLRWEAVTAWEDGKPLTAQEQAQVRYRISVGDSANGDFVAVSPDVSETSVPLTSIPQLTPGRYVGVTAVLKNSSSSTMSDLVRYAAPGEVLGLAIEAFPHGEMILSWRPVFRYADDRQLTPADQAQVRYRVEVGDNRTTMKTAAEQLEHPWVDLSAIQGLTVGQFISVHAYIQDRAGPKATAIHWQNQSTIGPARQSFPSTTPDGR